MEYPIADLVDRLSILHLKKSRIRGNVFDNEFNALVKAMEGYVARTGALLEANLIELITINGQIWDLEADIRQGKEGALGLEEVGRRALAIRDLNGKRVALKNAIAARTGGFKEVKKDHASE